MLDQTTSRSRGYGFVAFRNKEDADRALTEMNGEWLGSRAIRCNWANQKAGGMMAQQAEMTFLQQQQPQQQQLQLQQESPVSITNTTVYVGNLTPDVHDDLIRSIFQPFGVIEEVRTQRDKGYAFVRYSTHEGAKAAIANVSGQTIGTRPVKCSWGKERTGANSTPMPGPPPTMWGTQTYMGYQAPYQQPYPSYPPYPYGYGAPPYPPHQYGAPPNMYNNGFDQTQFHGNYHQKS